jgi:hypothetical protein
MQLKMLVLPAPLGPMTAKNWPRSTARLAEAQVQVLQREKSHTLVHPLVIDSCGERS